MISTGLHGLADATHDICVVGAGPVGITLALELARLGRSVLLLESGGTTASAETQRLADAEIAVAKHHVPMDIAIERSLGGASNLWGGRCVAMGPIDFEPRPAVPESGWPISNDDVTPYLAAACDYVRCGKPVFADPVPGITVSNTDFRFDQLERWSAEPRSRKLYERTLRASPAIDVRLRTTVIGFEFANDGRVARIQVAGPGEARATIAARCIVLAAGGLESTRLLLASRTEDGNRFGGEEGPLGRYYMGHLYGSAAEMVLHAPAVDAAIDYYLDPDGYYIRRRFTPSAELQRRMGLTNTSFWPDYPAIYDPRHHNGILSSAYLALSVPWIGRMILVESIRRNYVGSGPTDWWPHIKNILRDIVPTSIFLPQFFYRRYLARHRMPGFFQRNAARRYAVRFHAEHPPNPLSRVSLSHARDALGLPRLAIDLRYKPSDVEPLLRTHDCFAAWLESTGIGAMTWSVPREQLTEYIIDQCYDGHHQIGTTRMGISPTDGVVDANCRVFGAANLFVAGSSVFRTSAEANPTLTAVALALRLAALLNQEVGSVAT